MTSLKNNCRGFKEFGILSCCDKTKTNLLTADRVHLKSASRKWRHCYSCTNLYETWEWKLTNGTTLVRSVTLLNLPWISCALILFLAFLALNCGLECVRLPCRAQVVPSLEACLDPTLLGQLIYYRVYLRKVLSSEVTWWVACAVIVFWGSLVNFWPGSCTAV